jgi:hypothetical protein
LITTAEELGTLGLHSNYATELGYLLQDQKQLTTPREHLVDTLAVLEAEYYVRPLCCTGCRTRKPIATSAIDNS